MAEKESNNVSQFANDHNLDIRDLAVLGLGIDADLDSVEKAFALIARRNNAEMKEGALTPESKAKMIEVSSAYSRLIGKKDPAKMSDTEEKGGWFVGFNRTSVENFFYLFKLQFIVSIVLAIVIGIVVYSFIDRKEFQFSLQYWGATAADDVKVSDLVKTSDPGIKNVQFVTAQGLGASTDAQFAWYTLAVLDSIVIDKASYKSFAQQGFFLNLDDLAKEAGLDLSKQQEMIITSKNEKSDKLPHLYGLDISSIKNPNVKNAFISLNTVLTIPTNTTDLDPGKKFMRKIMSILAAEQKTTQIKN
ncbi:MAG: hypothetical protein WCQ41_05335 [Bacillota bacterium]